MLNIFETPTKIDRVKIKNHLINIIRLDQNDQEINGNKWLKLGHNLTDKTKRYATFGGPHSNHLHAFSFACKKLNIQHVVFVRGIGPKDTPTLLDIQKNNGLIIRLSKKDYAKKHEIQMQQRWQNLYGDMTFIPEGGNNNQASKACGLWFESLNIEKNAVIGVSIGTGCTFSGIAKSLDKTHSLVGLPAFYMNNEMESELLNSPTNANLMILNAQKQERFAKMTRSQWVNMLDFESLSKIKLDPVYTGKTLFRLIDNISQFNDRPIYFIHTGGLQGRRVYEQQYS